MIRILIAFLVLAFKIDVYTGAGELSEYYADGVNTFSAATLLRALFVVEYMVHSQENARLISQRLFESTIAFCMQFPLMKK
jgi:hypothetical protein